MRTKIVLILICVLLVISLPILLAKELSKKTESKVITTSSVASTTIPLEKLEVLLAELEVYDYKEAEGFYEISSNSGIVVYTVDLRNAEIKYDHINKKITVCLPSVEISDPEMNNSKPEFTYQEHVYKGDLKVGLEWGLKGEANASAMIRYNAQKDESLMNMAKENAISVVKSFMEQTLVSPYSDYEPIVYFRSEGK